MKIFVSYSHEDSQYAMIIGDMLENNGHDVWIDEWKLELGDNLFETIKEGLETTDVLLLIVSKNSLKSKWVKYEFSTMVFADISKGSSRIVPVLIDKSSVPSYLSNYMYIDLSDDFNSGLNKLVSSLSDISNSNDLKGTLTVVNKKESHDHDVTFLERALKEGRLTLVCGAGVSIGAGLPSWDYLLIKLLKSMIKKMSNNHDIQLDGDSAEEFRNRYAASSLIIGKYLKTNLGNDFLTELRNALYPPNTDSSPTIDAIVNLARPQRDRKPLDSIITFNFDTLIEEKLGKENIYFKSIYSEGVNHSSNELPIYHVHGVLPKNGEIPKESNVVFSEDAYHSQFIDPFSWSNLIQLNKLNQNTCLLLGISLTDPNLRRLLDVANRKNPDHSLNHYIIKKLPDNFNKNDKIDKLASLLEEQDANELGLNVIWVESFDEIPTLLNSICNYN